MQYKKNNKISGKQKDRLTIGVKRFLVGDPSGIRTPDTLIKRIKNIILNKAKKPQNSQLKGFLLLLFHTKHYVLLYIFNVLVVKIVVKSNNKNLYYCFRIYPLILKFHFKNLSTTN